MNLDLLGQLYLMCTVFGWGFITVSMLLGHFSHHDGAGAGSAHHSVDGGDAALGSHGHHIVPHLDMAHGVHHLGGHAGHGADLHTGSHTTHGPSVGGHSGSHGNGPASAANNSGSNHAGHGHQPHGEISDDSRTGAHALVSKHSDRNIYFTLLRVFSPMSISVFIGFFGVVGMCFRAMVPGISFLSLIPAVIAGIVAINVMNAIMTWATAKLTASSLVSEQQSIGQIAEVNTPIKDGRTGEVTYVVGLTRFNAPAKPATDGVDFERGSRVVIVDRSGPVVLVEAIKDDLLEG
jgi:hypothetical protein